MFTERHYVPILKTKQGERFALRDLKPQDKARLTPLLEVLPPVEVDEDEEAEDAQAAATRVDPTAKAIKVLVPRLVREWGTQAPAFVDLGLFDPDARIAGVHPLKVLMDECRNNGLKMVAVTSLDRDAAHQAAVRDAVTQDGRGCCLRITLDMLADPQLAQTVATTLTAVGASEPNIDLVLDLGAIRPDAMALLSATLPILVAKIPNLGAWRTFTMASGAFPDSLANITGTGSIDRLDWRLWRLVDTGQIALTRKPHFGDYGPHYPELVELPTAVPNVAASIRYTLNHEWLILRGVWLRRPGGPGYGQYQTFSQQLVGSANFAGPRFSMGDAYIDGCARGTESTGNPMKWMHVASNHHLTHVVRQLASPTGTLTYPVPIP